MPEKIQLFTESGELIGLKDRKEAYKEMLQEFHNIGKITTKVQTIRCLLFNEHGKILLQKRSRRKAQNPGMYDKSIGGHVVGNMSFEFTVKKEHQEELGIPVDIVSSDEYKLYIKNTDTAIMGILREVDYLENFLSLRKVGEEMVTYPQITKIYIGQYDGPIQFIDGESCGIEMFYLDELEKEIAQYPELFTEDIKFMIQTYKKYIKQKS